MQNNIYISELYFYELLHITIQIHTRLNNISDKIKEVILSAFKLTWTNMTWFTCQSIFVFVGCLSVCLLSLCLSFKSLIAYQLKLIFIPFNFIFIELNYCVYWIITLVVWYYAFSGVKQYARIINTWKCDFSPFHNWRTSRGEKIFMRPKKLIIVR